MKTKLLLITVTILTALGGLAQTQNQNAPAAPSPTASDANGVKYFNASDVTASFAKGGVLTEAPTFKVMTARRIEQGNVEIHKKLTDVFYIVQGSTTLVTGGKVVGEKATNPDEPRGDSIIGGESHQLSAGDVVVIPAGIPHWMKDVKGTLLYFVVKVI